MYEIIFYTFAVVTVLSAFVVVTSKNVIYAAYALLLTFTGIAGIYIYLSADFIAIVQIIVYVGGILILLLFGIMLTNKITNVDIISKPVHIIPAILGAAIFCYLLISNVLANSWGTDSITDFSIKTDKAIGFSPHTESSVHQLGISLMLNYSLIFVLLGFLLLIALIGAATIARFNSEKVND